MRGSRPRLRCKCSATMVHGKLSRDPVPLRPRATSEVANVVNYVLSVQRAAIAAWCTFASLC